MLFKLIWGSIMQKYNVIATIPEINRSITKGNRCLFERRKYTVIISVIFHFYTSVFDVIYVMRTEFDIDEKRGA